MRMYPTFEEFEAARKALKSDKFTPQETVHLLSFMLIECVKILSWYADSNNYETKDLSKKAKDLLEEFKLKD